MRWGYAFDALGEGTRVTDSWEFLPESIALFKGKFGANAQTQIVIRTSVAHERISATLAAIKRTAECV